MIDEATDAELKIVSSCFTDHYVLVIRDDASICVLEATRSGELEELSEMGALVVEENWLSGSLYKPSGPNSTTFAFLLSARGGLRVCGICPFLLKV